ncbi:60S ribosomal protein L14 [Datura stramonium]|uniref:60S ribosomal protein L14 n=1 Tax=Datura stramonium TaxID=4076 RepID=A0ABS8SRG1_DATST|nr:60S ribosomal protein L14 [Datura stramonium]
MRKKLSRQFCSRDGIQKQPSTITPKEPDSALEPALITSRQIEAGRRAMTRIARRGGKRWYVYFPDKPVTLRPRRNTYGFREKDPLNIGAIPNMPLERSEVVRAVSVRTCKELKRDNGMIIRYDDNAAVVIDQEGNPKELEFWCNRRGKIRHSFLRILPGDRVKIEFLGPPLVLLDSEYEEEHRLLLKPQQQTLSVVDPSKRLYYGRFILSPLMKGQADTIGIAMRRALLGEIEGTCITRVGNLKVPHRYSTITGIQVGKKYHSGKISKGVANGSAGSPIIDGSRS